ncbi:hypothetical protein [Streptomyces sp. NBC_00328]|uniref:hypothetical protein n=1 Tax=Streptomyces sp. NBC_00328 TaxID=2903646 RepID=UPI002E291500|nr:hypothetical protein [Streptomyces sp. NBC_00328]
MAKTAKQPPQGPGPRKSEGERQLRWGPSVNDESQQPNPSAHRSFHPDTYAPEPDEPRKAPTKKEKEASAAGTPSDSLTARAEDRGKSEGTHDTGRHGASRRPSGKKDASAYTGVNPDDSPAGDGSR